MERCRKILHKLLFPGAAVCLLGVPVSAALLFYIFFYGHEDEPVAYAAYVLSAYVLIVVCARLPRLVKSGSALVHRNALFHRFLTDVAFRMHVSMYLSFTVNLLYAVMKLSLGVYYRSVWLESFGVYYTLLALMRFLLLRHAKRNAFGKELVSELRRYRICGILLLPMNLALCGVVILVVKQNQGFAYPGYLIYVMAMYAFYSSIVAVVNVVKYRKYNSPVMSAEKAVALATALVSMLSLETAMLAQFDDGSNGEHFRTWMTASTGGAVCAFILGMAVFMIARSTKRLQVQSGTEVR
ncbi:MAG: hypothetical protein Q4C48_07500 [Lachnospiraceae bacterium]|nr:hypothetical protein [Lachnospiraceae bacterium]